MNTTYSDPEIDGFEDGEGAPPKSLRKKKKEKSPYYYEELAKQFLMDNGTTYRYHQARVLRWDGKRYVVEPELSVRLRRFFTSVRIPHNNTVIGNVAPIVQALT